MEILPRNFKEPDRMATQEVVIQAVMANPHIFLIQYCKDPRTFEGRFVNSDLMKETFTLHRRLFILLRGI